VFHSFILLHVLNRLGGFTVDAATTEELIAIGQRSDDGCITLSNASHLSYPTCTFAISECEAVASDTKKYGTRVWDPAHWSSYVKGALTFMLCERFPMVDAVKRALHPSSPSSTTELPGMRLLVSSIRRYQLPASGGIDICCLLLVTTHLCYAIS
jgi:hypothetical protein